MYTCRLSQCIVGCVKHRTGRLTRVWRELQWMILSRSRLKPCHHKHTQTRPLALHHQRTTKPRKQQSHDRSSSLGSTMQSQRVTWPSLSEMSKRVIMEQSLSLFCPVVLDGALQARRGEPAPSHSGQEGAGFWAARRRLIGSERIGIIWKKTRFVIESLLASWGCNWSNTHTHVHKHTPAVKRERGRGWWEENESV